MPVACPIGRSTPESHGHSRTDRYGGSPADGQADPRASVMMPRCGRAAPPWPGAGRGARVAGRGVPRYSHGYKARVFTGAICPVPYETENRRLEGSADMTGTTADIIPIIIVPVVALAFMLIMVNYANSHPQWGRQA